MSDRCCVDPGAKQSHTAEGVDEKVAGLNTYKTGEGKSVIVIFTDIFGYSFINTRRLADSFAKATGTTVLIPDFFDGDPLVPDAPDLYDQLPSWKLRHPVDQACVSADKYISTIKGHYECIQVKARLFFLVKMIIFFVDYRFLLRCESSSTFD
jgi:dienelactone hydrolase